MDALHLSFRSWVPEWIIRITLFSCLMPSMLLFFIPGINIKATAGYYGCQPNDAQILIHLFYCGFAAFYLLERRFFHFFSIKTYYLLFHCVQITICIAMYYVTELYQLYILRFISGMLFASAVNLSMSMIFARLKGSSAKVISYSVFFGLLLLSSPFNNLLFSWVLDEINFQQIYAFTAFSFFPGLLFAIGFMKQSPHQQPYPLIKLDVSSFILYALLFVSFAYMAIYGQERYWFTHFEIRLAATIFIIALILFLWRQLNLKRPYINLSIFKVKRMWMGVFVLLCMYVERFSLQLTNRHFETILGLDPEHIAYLNIAEMAGIVVGVVIGAWWTLKAVPIKYIWISGFATLFLFHAIMFHRFENFGNEDLFYAPLLAHGIAVGILMVPSILFIISTVKEQLGMYAAAFALATRFTGHALSAAIINYIDLRGQRIHYQVFQETMVITNIQLEEQLSLRENQLLEHGLQQTSENAGLKTLIQNTIEQAQIRSAMDYYELLMCLSVLVILLILAFPAFKFRFQKWGLLEVAPV